MNCLSNLGSTPEQKDQERSLVLRPRAVDQAGQALAAAWTKCRRGKSSGSSSPKPRRDLHARAKSSQTSSTGPILCGIKAQIAKPGVCMYKSFESIGENTDSSAQNGQENGQNGSLNEQSQTQGKTKRAKSSTTSTNSPDSAQSDTGEADIYSPLSRTNTQTSRLKAQLTGSKDDAKGEGQICNYTVDITVLNRTAFENSAWPFFEGLAGIIEESKTEQLKLKEEWVKPTITLINKPSLNMWYIQKTLFLSKIDKTMEALSGSGTTTTSGSSSQADSNANENENTEGMGIQQYLTDTKVKVEIGSFATKFASSMARAFAKAVEEAEACATSAEKKVTKI
ncbi:hypothetical protein DFS33DRAFT_1386106 [Desarmillaria ectypa]|nr:hypothetical protein DFS33DRAFT_1386106 [Desarmillaria ectypa]